MKMSTDDKRTIIWAVGLAVILLGMLAIATNGQ